MALIKCSECSREDQRPGSSLPALRLSEARCRTPVAFRDFVAPQTGTASGHPNQSAAPPPIPGVNASSQRAYASHVSIGGRQFNLAVVGGCFVGVVLVLLFLTWIGWAVVFRTVFDLMAVRGTGQWGSVCVQGVLGEDAQGEDLLRDLRARCFASAGLVGAWPARWRIWHLAAGLPGPPYVRYFSGVVERVRGVAARHAMDWQQFRI